MARGRSKDLTQTIPIRAAGELEELVADALGRRKTPLVLVMSGECVGTRCRVTGPVVVGRDPEADLPLPDVGISWHHARFEPAEDNAVVVIDMGSTNGTFLNEQPIERAVVSDGDTIAVGATILKLEMVDGIEAGFHAKLERILNHDDLTGLLQRRRFDTEVMLFIEAANTQGTRLALLLMDLDGVKQINDQHGHHFGAHTIAETGRLIGRLVGSRGLATRFGGDEFAVMLPGLDGEAAFALAGEVREGVERHAFELEGIVLRPSISIGLAVLPENGDSLEALMRHADSALYRAKAAGRNRVSR